MPLNNFASKLGKIGDAIKDAAENVIDKIDDKVDLPIIIGESPLITRPTIAVIEIHQCSHIYLFLPFSQISLP